MLKRMHLRLRQHIASTFGGEGLSKELLLNGFVVLEFASFVVQAPQLEGKEVMPEQREYFHVSLHYSSPFGMTLTKLRPLQPSCPSMSEVIMMQPELHIQTKSLDEHAPFYDLWDVLDESDLRRRMEVTLYELSDSARVLGKPFRPASLEMRRLSATEACLWKGSSVERVPRRRKPKPAQSGQQADSDNSDDMGGDVGNMLQYGSCNGSGSSDNSDEAPSDEDPEFPIGAGFGFIGNADMDGDATAHDLGDPLLNEAWSANEDPSIACHDGASSDSSSTSGYQSSEYRSVRSSELASCGSSPSSGDEDSANDFERPDQARVGEDDLAPRQGQDGLSVFNGSVLVSTGCLKFNPSNMEFYAKCPCEGHGRCIATRTVKSGRRPWQGRPLGFLSAWVSAASSCADKAAHMAFVPTYEERRAARRDLHKQEQAGILARFEVLERERRPGEDSEPECFR